MPAMDGGGDMTVMLLDGQDAHGAPDNGVDCEAKLKSGHEVGDGADRVDGGNGNDARHGDGAGVTIMTMMTNTCKGMSACSLKVVWGIRAQVKWLLEKDQGLQRSDFPVFWDPRR
ncbi:hypothetical protein AK812_SmicGene18420 [Symbiodinium microadriaticum]|uniref:Uncharacterized protein n=1 Tax=Symbiodinium microadriaticum TaxID=2951 RepID=A0A1Q9DV62_SYMMI|nr:hypothetical protein AK812_SmicGene18420 [Symbiodinium microadriaticum]